MPQSLCFGDAGTVNAVGIGPELQEHKMLQDYSHGDNCADCCRYTVPNRVLYLHVSHRSGSNVPNIRYLRELHSSNHIHCDCTRLNWILRLGIRQGKRKCEEVYKYHVQGESKKQYLRMADRSEQVVEVLFTCCNYWRETEEADFAVWLGVRIVVAFSLERVFTLVTLVSVWVETAISVEEWGLV